jgi:hypothetical protein
MIPFVPIIHEDEEPFSMFRDLKQKYGEWVLDVLEYDSVYLSISSSESMSQGGEIGRRARLRIWWRNP